MTERQPPRLDGRTQASSVMPSVRSRSAAPATVTHALVPLNDSAEPNLPAAVHVALLIVPGWALPRASTAVVPEPSLKPHAATRPFPLTTFSTSTPTGADVVRLPNRSRATAVSV